jgi:hypothetical protein
MSDQTKRFQRETVGRVDRLRARSGSWLSLCLLYLMVCGYAGVLGGVVVVAVGKHLPDRVLPVLGIGCLLPAYWLAVQTVAWWRSRQTWQG